MKDEKCYDICILSLDKYKLDRILKITEKTKLKEIGDLDFNVEGKKLAKTKLKLASSDQSIQYHLT